MAKMLLAELQSWICARGVGQHPAQGTTTLPP